MDNSANLGWGERLSAALDGTIFRAIRWVEVTDSTNADLLAAARAGAPHGSVLATNHQRAGKGRLDRVWHDTRGDALLVSVLLRPDDLVAPAWLVSAMAIALVEAVDGVGVDAGIKWPNDVVVARAGGNKKLAGILAESVVVDGKVDAVIVGVGCNVTSIPVAADEIATSIEAECGHAVDRVQLLVDTLTRLHTHLESPHRLAASYRAKSVTIGRNVRVEMHERTVAGTAIDIDADGRLRIETAAGEEVVTVGDVVHLRPNEPHSGQ